MRHSWLVAHCDKISDSPEFSPCPPSRKDLLGSSKGNRTTVHARRSCVSGDRQAGFWSKALAESDGDESKAKAKCVQQRAQQIKSD